jgi:hypothetical protein
MHVKYYGIIMRTSILLDDHLAKAFRKAAKERGLSLSAFISESGKAYLNQITRPRSKSFELICYGEGGVQESVNLDQTNTLLARDDERTYQAKS